jgi:hypothetical protein
MIEPGTLLPSTPGHVPHSGRRSAPPAGNALDPPNVLIPTYPSSTLNNYYHQPTSFISHDQNVHIFAPVPSFAPFPLNFYDPNVLPPSASQSQVPTI